MGLLGLYHWSADRPENIYIVCMCFLKYNHSRLRDERAEFVRRLNV